MLKYEMKDNESENENTIVFINENNQNQNLYKNRKSRATIFKKDPK